MNKNILNVFKKGPMGLQGLKGMRGEVGLRGEMGMMGLQGRPGEVGAPVSVKILYMFIFERNKKMFY